MARLSSGKLFFVVLIVGFLVMVSRIDPESGEVVLPELSNPAADRIFKEAVDAARSFLRGAVPELPETNGNRQDDIGWVTGFRITKVIDGDTVEVVTEDNERSRVRLHGIDAPERDQPFGRASREALADMVAGRNVQLDLRDKDKYGRYVAVIYVDDRNVNLAMVRTGMAWWYEFFARDDRDLAAAQEEARRLHRGLWEEDNPIQPCKWRKTC